MGGSLHSRILRRMMSHGWWAVLETLTITILRLVRNARLNKVATRASRTTFGHPSRRMTDLLILANVAAFGAQLLTKQGLTVWGAKVGEMAWVQHGS